MSSARYHRRIVDPTEGAVDSVAQKLQMDIDFFRMSSSDAAFAPRSSPKSGSSWQAFAAAFLGQF
jgi:hypothetical protein